MKPLRTGMAYHGNRMLHHAEADFKDMAAHNMNLVVHMLSHTDWDRHKNVMKTMVELSEEAGLEVWMDNWGLGGPPGDKSHFLSYYPDSHQIYSDGTMDPTRVCLASEDFRRFMHEWIDVVAWTGCKTIFWDEPHLPMGANNAFSCACPRCRKRFEEKYGHPMPSVLTPEAEEFRLQTIVDFFADITEYAHNKGLINTVCVMLGDGIGINLDSIASICSLPYLDDIGSDPYWGYDGKNPYEFVYNGTKKNIDVSNHFGKDHNIWIQMFGVPRGREEEIVQATEAAYDAGARTILSWGYYGSISNDYGAKNPALTQAKWNAAMERIWGWERDRILAENRAKYMK